MLQQLLEICTKENVFTEEPMCKYTTFKTGGEADVLVLPETGEELKAVLQLANKQNVPVTVVGNGSNLLVSDSGIRGLVVCTKKMQKIVVSGTEITAMCGASMASLAAAAKQNSLTGLEFASGIPGTVGGGIVMNAGAYGGSLSDCAVKTLCMDMQGNEIWFEGDEQAFGYRKSAFSGGNYIVVKTVFLLHDGVESEIADKMKDLNQRRKDKQPLDKPSAGSTFKRPEGYFAGKLIEDAGLKGYRTGGASVSEKHAGFVVNDRNGTSADILAVIRHCQAVVLEKFGVTLETEVKMLGKFN